MPRARARPLRAGRFCAAGGRGSRSAWSSSQRCSWSSRTCGRPTTGSAFWCGAARSCTGTSTPTARPRGSRLPFLFTLPYAVAGRGQLWLWMGTAVAGAILGSVFAARVAFRLTGVGGDGIDRRYAPYVAGAFAGIGLLGINTLMHLVLIANSDALIVAALLAAIDCHLCRRYRLAFGMLVLASLGRPEAWVFAGLYGVWLMWKVPKASTRLLVVVGPRLHPGLLVQHPGAHLQELVHLRGSRPQPADGDPRQQDRRRRQPLPQPLRAAHAAGVAHRHRAGGAAP